MTGKPDVDEGEVGLQLAGGFERLGAIVRDACPVAHRRQARRRAGPRRLRCRRRSRTRFASLGLDFGSREAVLRGRRPLSRSNRRQPHDEFASAPGSLALRGHRAAVHRRDALDDRQAKPEAPGGTIDRASALLEEVEHARHQLRAACPSHCPARAAPPARSRRSPRCRCVRSGRCTSPRSSQRFETTWARRSRSPSTKKRPRGTLTRTVWCRC